MICYMDRAFCAASLRPGEDRCTNNKCSRNFDDEHRDRARRWWGGDGAPISSMDMQHADCGYSAALPSNKDALEK